MLCTVLNISTLPTDLLENLTFKIYIFHGSVLPLKITFRLPDNFQFSLNLRKMFWECGKEPEHPQKIQAKYRVNMQSPHR